MQSPKRPLMCRRSSLDLLGTKPQRGLHAALAQVLDLASQLVIVVQANNLICAANADAIDQHVGHRAAARLGLEQVLKFRAQRVLIQLDDKRRWFNAVFFEEDALGAFREWAI